MNIGERENSGSIIPTQIERLEFLANQLTPEQLDLLIKIAAEFGKTKQKTAEASLPKAEGFDKTKQAKVETPHHKVEAKKTIELSPLTQMEKMKEHIEKMINDLEPVEFFESLNEVGIFVSELIYGVNLKNDMIKNNQDLLEKNGAEIKELDTSLKNYETSLTKKIKETIMKNIDLPGDHVSFLTHIIMGINSGDIYKEDFNPGEISLE